MPIGPDFEDSEFAQPYEALREAGHEVIVIGQKAGKEVQGKGKKEKVIIERAARDANPSEFDAVVIPGGYSPDHLRIDESVVAFIKEFSSLGRPIAAVCHGPQLLIEAEVVRDRTMTSWPSVRKDLENAGARWVDREVCEDGSLITSRKPEDLEAFSKAILRRLAA